MLGQILLKQGYISEKELYTALEYAQKHHIRLGLALIRLGYIDDITLAKALSEQAGLPFLDIKQWLKEGEYPSSHLINEVPKSFCKKHLLLPIKENLNEYEITVYDPYEKGICEIVKYLPNKAISLKISPFSHILDAINYFYPNDEYDKKELKKTKKIFIFSTSTPFQEFDWKIFIQIVKRNIKLFSVLFLFFFLILYYFLGKKPLYEASAILEMRPFPGINFVLPEEWSYNPFGLFKLDEKSITKSQILFLKSNQFLLTIVKQIIKNQNLQNINQYVFLKRVKNNLKIQLVEKENKTYNIVIVYRDSSYKMAYLVVKTIIDRYLDIQRTVFKIAFKIKKLTLIENKKEKIFHLWKTAKANPTDNEYVLNNQIIQLYYQKLLDKKLEFAQLKSMYHTSYKLNEIQQEIKVIKNNIKFLSQKIIKGLYQEVKDYEDLQNQIENQINILVNQLKIYFPTLKKSKYGHYGLWIVTDIFKISPLFIANVIEQPSKEYLDSVILKKIKIAIKSILVAFFLALLIIGIYELIDPRIKDVYQIERRFHYPVIMVIPFIKNSTNFYETILNKQNKIPQIFTIFSQFVGLFLSLDINLVPITSPKPHSGRKTLLLGCIDHFMGEKLLVINADIVNCEGDEFKKLFSSQQKEYNLYNMLKDYVFDKEKLKAEVQNMLADSVREVNGESVYFINIDKSIREDTKTLFSTEILYEFVSWIQHFFDRILLILPPLNTSIGIDLASNFDDLVIVFRGNHTTIYDLKTSYLFIQTIKPSPNADKHLNKNIFLVANGF